MSLLPDGNTVYSVDHWGLRIPCGRAFCIHTTSFEERHPAGYRVSFFYFNHPLPFFPFLPNTS